jgi:hypothetical protein
MSKSPVILTKFLPDIASNKEGLEKLNNLSEIFDGKLTIFVPLPNFSANKRNHAPSGFAVQAKANDTPVHPDLFDDKMFKRAFAFELPEGSRILNLQEPISAEVIMKNNDRLRQLLNSAFSEEQPEAKISLKFVDKEDGKETQAWKEEMGKHGSFAGLFVQSERGDYYYKDRFFIVAQTYSPSANDEILKLMIDASPDEEVGPTSKPKNTFETFFDLGKNKDLNTLARMSKRNSQRILAKFASLINLQDANGTPIQFESDHMAFVKSEKEQAPWLLHPTIDMPSNIVEKYQGNMIYRNGAVDPTSHKNGILFCEAPFLGVSIFKGPVTQNLKYGGSWSASKESLGSFPIHTGRQKDARALKQDIAKHSKVAEKTPFVWTDCEKTVNSRLVVYTYRTRDSSWKKIEAQLGFDHSNGEIHLKPLVVKIASDRK